MKIKCFGIAKDITSMAQIEIIEEERPLDVKALREYLNTKYPAFQKMSSCMIAVNQEYADDTLSISNQDEIAIIPPVSGG